jgi:hypothetical protein
MRPPLFLFVAIAMSGLARPVDAQTARALEVSAGYEFTRDPSLDVNFPAGWHVGVAASVRAWLSIAGSYDDSRRTIASPVGDLRFGLRAAMGGLRASARVGRATEFGQVLAGAVRASGSAFGESQAATHFGVQAGGGIDYPFGSKLAARIELDYRVVANSGGDLGRQFRALTGLAFAVF